MSVKSWAYQVYCDYPACKSEGESQALDNPPAGWLSLAGASMRVTDAFGRQLSDFCTLHADVPLSKLAELLRLRGEETS